MALVSLCAAFEGVVVVGHHGRQAGMPPAPPAVDRHSGRQAVQIVLALALQRQTVVARGEQRGGAAVFQDGIVGACRSEKQCFPPAEGQLHPGTAQIVHLVGRSVGKETLTPAAPAADERLGTVVVAAACREPLSQMHTVVAQGHRAQGSPAGVVDVERIGIKRPVAVLHHWFAVVLFCRYAGREALAQGVAVTQGGVEAVAGVAAVLESLPTVEGPFGVGGHFVLAVAQPVPQRGRGVGCHVAAVNELARHIAGEGVHAVDELQLLYRENGAAAFHVAQYGVYLCLAEEGYLQQVFALAVVQVYGVLVEHLPVRHSVCRGLVAGICLHEVFPRHDLCPGRSKHQKSQKGQEQVFHEDLTFHEFAAVAASGEVPAYHIGACRQDGGVVAFAGHEACHQPAAEVVNLGLEGQLA